MGTLVAVDGATLLQNDLTVVCTITPIGLPSTINKAEGKGYLLDEYQVTVSAITVPTASATIPDPGPYTVAFTAGSSTVKENGTLPLIEGDVTDAINATPKIPSTPNPIDYPITFKIEITVAGQIKVKII